MRKNYVRIAIDSTDPATIVGGEKATDKEKYFTFIHELALDLAKKKLGMKNPKVSIGLKKRALYTFPLENGASFVSRASEAIEKGIIQIHVWEKIEENFRGFAEAFNFLLKDGIILTKNSAPWEEMKESMKSFENRPFSFKDFADAVEVHALSMEDLMKINKIIR